MQFETRNPIQSWKSSTSYKAVLGVNVNEPVQGAINDCHVIAALSAVAWASDASRAKITYPPTFSGVSWDVKKEFPMDGPSGGGSPIYARSNSAYVWPMIYEKAYAKKRGAQMLPTPETDPDHIDIWVLNNVGNAANIVKEITNWTQPHEFSLANMNLVTGTSDPNYVNSLYNPVNLPRETSGRVSYPSVAWTGAISPLTGIYPDHAYTLLGYYTYSGITYVVLRNPSKYKTTTPRCEEPTANVCITGTWNGINLANTQDMIFALDISKFKQYFQTYGFVHG